MKAYLCDKCKKSPARYKVRIRLVPYFEKDEPVSVIVGDICKECLPTQYPELKDALKG